MHRILYGWATPLVGSVNKYFEYSYLADVTQSLKTPCPMSLLVLSVPRTTNVSNARTHWVNGTEDKMTGSQGNRDGG